MLDLEVKMVLDPEVKKVLDSEVKMVHQQVDLTLRVILAGCFPLAFLNELMYKANSWWTSTAATTCAQICIALMF